MHTKRKRSFTLMELAVVVVIIGVLAAIGYPGYTKLRETTYQKEAVANIRLISAAERSYGMELGNYFNGDAVNSINDALHLSLTEKNWDYRIQTGAGTYTVTAVRNCTGKPYCACTYTFTQSSSEPTSAGCNVF
ncbi:MAG: prepilin-type N-terminal cleavage/methylation domain-containing protein [Candidatus Omnitrophica bacterium]|nr:prepilin-type N-terminal cleavage/methylation domain-containing protein [Candidatus Omnitrophota bacterium]